MRKTIMITTAAALLSSCGIYTKYERPEDIQTEDLYGATIEEETESLASMPWQELFSDPMLRDLISKALESNSDLEKARLQVEQADAALMAARRAFLPSLALNPQIQVGTFDGEGSAAAYNLGAAASWQVDIFGKLRNAKEQSRAALLASKEYEQAVQTSIISSVANLYYTLLMLDQQLEISKQSSEYMEQTAKMMKSLYTVGMQTEAAVSQANASVLSTKQSVVSLEKSVNDAEVAMSSLLLQTPQTIKRGKLSDQELQDELAVGISLDMISNRPDVRSAESQLAQAFYGVNGARAAFYPSINLSGSAGWTNSIGVIVDPAGFLLSAIAQLTQPIFSNGQLAANLKITKAQYEQSKLTFQQTVINAGGEVNKALVQCQTARKKAVLLDEQLSELERAVNSTRLLMKHGSTTYLEVLTDEQNYLQARISQVSNWFDEAQGIVTLYQALGGGTTRE